ncbi:MAG: hypothetical protein PVI43_00140 [Candidatus Bathyarchaeota archaeon]|jgi:hypothetical protein
MNKSAEDFNGTHIHEVWDSRLSKAAPTIYNPEGGTWFCRIHAHDGSGVLAEYDTGIKVVPGDDDDRSAFKEIYAWLHSVRDEFSRDDIDEQKEILSLRRACDEELHSLNKQLADEWNANGGKKTSKYYELKGRYNEQLMKNKELIQQAKALAAEKFEQRMEG